MITSDREYFNPKGYPIWSLVEAVLRIPSDVLLDGEKMLLLRLYLYANTDTGVAFPKRDIVARELGGLSLSQIDRRITRLEALGFIETARRGKTQSNCYRFLLSEFLYEMGGTRDE